MLFSAPKKSKDLRFTKGRQPHWASRIAKLNLIARVGKHPKNDMIFMLIWHFISQHLSYIYKYSYLYTHFSHPSNQDMGFYLILILSPLSLRRLFRHKVTVLDMFAILQKLGTGNSRPTIGGNMRHGNHVSPTRVHHGGCFGEISTNFYPDSPIMIEVEFLP